MTKFWKLKIWIDSFVAFSVGYVVKYIIFSVDAVFMEKFATQNRLFLDFSKNQKNVDFVRQITTPRMHPKNFWLFLSRSIFRWLHHGIQYFFCRGCLWGAIRETKLSDFRIFAQNWSSPKNGPQMWKEPRHSHRNGWK